MDYIKEENFKRVLSLVQGGVDGITKLVCEYYKLVNKTKIKRQVLKSDNLAFNLNDIDIAQISIVIQTIAYNQFEYDSSNELFHGFVDMFDDRDLAAKCYEFIDNSELLDFEKDDLKKIIKNFRYEVSLMETVSQMFECFHTKDYASIDDFITDFKIERECRLQKLRSLLSKLEISISENDEVLKSKAKPHLKAALKLCNKNYTLFYNKIRIDLQDYVSAIDDTVKVGEVNDSFKKSREVILNKLIDGTENRNLYSKFEILLKEKGYISYSLNQWLLNPIDFIRFYVFCENNDIFYYKFKSKRSGIKLLRNLYNFYEGGTMDYPNKRKKELSSSKEVYYFLYTAK